MSPEKIPSQREPLIIKMLLISNYDAVGNLAIRFDALGKPQEIIWEEDWNTLTTKDKVRIVNGQLFHFSYTEEDGHDIRSETIVDSNQTQNTLRRIVAKLSGEVPAEKQASDLIYQFLQSI